MTDDVRGDLAAIRQAIEDGRRFAAGGGSFMVIWGGVIGLADLATYLVVQGWLAVDPSSIWSIWAVCIPFAWAATMFLAWREHRVRAVSSLAGRALAMTWLGCGITLSILYLCTVVTGDFQPGWFLAIVAGAMGIGFFVSAVLCAYSWMRAVAVLWWLGEGAFFAWGADSVVLVLAAAMMLLMLAVPGLVLLRRETPSPA